MKKDLIIKDDNFALSIKKTKNLIDITNRILVEGRARRELSIKKSQELINREEVWQDPDTNLIWQLKVENKQYTWEEASKYVETLNKDKYGGYSDWRLPNIDELLSLGNIKMWDYRIDSNVNDWIIWFKKNKHLRNKTSKGHPHFIKKPLIESLNDIKFSWFWSSTPYKNDSSQAYYVNFRKGNACWDDKSDDNYVRCVRERQ